MKSKVRFKFASPARGLALLLASAMMSGCGGSQTADYDKLGLVEIGGTIKLDGAPVSGASVKFVSPDETYCIGVTDTSGHYTMMLDSRKSGVVPGEKVVQISSRAPRSEEGGQTVEEDPDAKPTEAEKIPACYNKDSILKIKVTQADSAMDFDLKSDCSTTSFQ